MRDAFPVTTDQVFLENMVASVNHYRAKHGVPPVTLDDTLVDYAKSRASLISTEEGLSRGHADLDHTYGENLSWHASTDETPAGAEDATSGWYGEITDYNFGDPSSSGPGATGHFTQLVWRETTKVGFGRASGKGGEWWETYIVATFYPAGNMQGEYEANVPPASA
ncbi:CAP family protein [Micromonospora sp. NBC_01796]|uniref:CAP family protein n=1 Tax=Micromonospora sp. NBC_01796 TaxID=2975987 RepID=UPI002DD95A79|nr:CAP family protein [Micromonospora sp. NBC_01796]WSA83065.1 CAP family protein [Micromonospora sp. NBC_01796]